MYATGIIEYFYDFWNVLDCFIVAISFASFAVSIGFLRVIRQLKAFRALRAIDIFPELKLIVESLLVAVKNATMAFLFYSSLLFVFSLLGIGFFKGQFRYCIIVIVCLCVWSALSWWVWVHHSKIFFNINRY